MMANIYEICAEPIGSVVLTLLFLFLGLLALFLLVSLALAILRKCREIRYGLIGYYGHKKMEKVVRQHLEKLVVEEAIRIVNEREKKTAEEQEYGGGY